MALRIAGRLMQVTDRLLTPGGVQRCAIVVLAAMLLLFAGGIAGWRSCTAPICKPVASDLAPHLTAARILSAGDPQRLYNLSYQFAVEQQVLGGHIWHDSFISPPFVGYLYIPLTRLPFLAGAGTWSVLTVALLVLSLRLLWPLLPNLHRFGFARLALIALSAEFVFDLLGSGQDSAVSLLIFTIGLRLLLAKRDAQAGAVLALGLMKPQLAILFPLLFLAQRQWKALGAWLAVAALLAAGSVAAVGPDGAASYVRLVASSAYEYGAAAPLSFKELSVIALVHGILPSQALRLVLPVAGAILLPLTIGFVRLACRKMNGETGVCLLYSLTVTLTVLISPHVFAYDGVLLLLPALVLADQGLKRPQIRLSLVLTYVLAWAEIFRYVAFGTLTWPLSVLNAPWTVAGVLLIYRELYLELARRLSQPLATDEPGHWPIPSSGPDSDMASTLNPQQG